MKKPNLKNLKINRAKTDQIRSAMADRPSIKITINIEAESLAKLKSMANESGVPYQRLLNKTLTEGLTNRPNLESRINQIEKAIKALQKQLAA